MDPFRRIHSHSSKDNLKTTEFQRKRDFSKQIAETDENESPLLHNGAHRKLQDAKKQAKENFLLKNTSSAFKNNILAERKEDTLAKSSQSSYLEITPHAKSMVGSDPIGVPFPISPMSFHYYDPITNYTSPRPEFLRYNPNLRRGLLQSIDRERRGKKVLSASLLSSPSASNEGGNCNHSENEEEQMFKEEKQQSWHSSVLWNLLLVFGVLMFIFFCVSCGSYPTFEGSENSADKFQKIQVMDPLGLQIFMNLFHMCPIVRESSCNLIYLEMEGMLGREKLREEESWDEGIGSGLYDKTEAVAAAVQDLVLQNGGRLANNDSVVEETVEGDELKQWNPWHLAEQVSFQKSIIVVETMKEKCIASSSDESSLASQAQNVSSSLLTNQLDEFHLESLELHEHSRIFQSKFHQSAPPDLKESNFSLTSDTELNLEYSSYKFSLGDLSLALVFVSSLVVIVGLFSVFSKYFRMWHLNSLPVPPSAETEEKIATVIKEENLPEAVDIAVDSMPSRLNAGLLPLGHPNAKEVSRIGQPRVELLEEFSLTDAGFSNLCSKLNKKEYSDTNFSYRQTSQERKMLSPSLDVVHSAAFKESTSSRFCMKVIADKREASNVAITPLRRSSRLRSRLTSPRTLEI